MGYIWLILHWFIFYAAHSLLASSRVKWGINTALPVMNYLYRILYNIFSTIYFLWIMHYMQSLPKEFIYSPQRLSNSAGIIFSLLGLLLILISFKYYDKSEFIGLRSLRYGDKIFGDKPVLHGPNRYVRHPLYFAILLLMLGYFFYYPFWSSLISVLCGVIYLIIGIHYEEKKLVRQFGDAYIAYQKSTPKLIPFLW